jgi:hypothetical protein
MMKTLMRSAVPLTQNELLHLQLIAELFSERLVRHFARTQDLPRIVGALSIATRRLSAQLIEDSRPLVAAAAFTSQLLQHAVLRCAHAAALVEQHCLCDMSHLSNGTRLLLFLLYDNAWFYRAPLDAGRERGIAANRAAAAEACRLQRDAATGAYVRRFVSPERERVTRELSEWGALAPDQSNAVTIFTGIVTRNPEQRNLFLPAVALRFGDRVEMRLESVRLAFAAVAADESERLTFELVHFVLDKHPSVQALIQSGNWQGAVGSAAALLNRFAWDDRVVPVETVLAALLSRADDDALAHGVLLHVLVLSNGVRQWYHAFAQRMFDAPFDNDAALARHQSGAEFAHWHYSTFHERLMMHRFDAPPSGVVYFTHVCSRLSLYVELALRRFLRCGQLALVLETLRHGAHLLQFHAAPSSLALQLCCAVAERATADRAAPARAAAALRARRLVHGSVVHRRDARPAREQRRRRQAGRRCGGGARRHDGRDARTHAGGAPGATVRRRQRAGRRRSRAGQRGRRALLARRGVGQHGDAGARRGRVRLDRRRLCAQCDVGAALQRATGPRRCQTPTNNGLRSAVPRIEVF